MFDCTLWGGRGYCSIARNVRTAAACVYVCVCVTLMDAPMERRTDAWADLTACSGGAAHIVAARLGRKHPRSAESHQSPILPPKPGGTDRLTGSPRGGAAARRSDSLGGSRRREAVSPAIDERERRGAAAPHLAQRKTGGERQTAAGNSPFSFFSFSFFFHSPSKRRLSFVFSVARIA